MTRSLRIARNIAVVVALLVLTVAIAALITLRTEWFRNYVRQKIVAAIEDGTGGRAQVGSFDFDESHLRATVTGLVIHGTEPAGAAPFLRVSSATAELRIFSRLNRLVDISSVIVERPQANIIILPDGRSNIPTPRNSQPSATTPLKTVVDLAIGHFTLNDGALTLESHKVPLNADVTNLRALLSYNLLAQTYNGEISFAPVYVVRGHAMPVTVNVSLPLTIGSDRIELHHANISTASSVLSIDGSMKNIRAPEIAARVNGTLAVAELKTALGLPVVVNARGVPAQLRLAADIATSKNSIRISRLQTTLGASSIDGTGTSNGLSFRSTLDLSELGRLFMVPGSPEGSLALNGDANIAADNAWSLTGKIRATGVGFQQGATKIRNVSLSSTVNANQDDVELGDLEVAAFGGRFDGTGSFQSFQRYKVDGTLRSFDLDSALTTLGEKLPYEGSITGTVSVAGDLEKQNSLAGRARLAITPGTHGIPVSGRINADYTATSDDLTIRNSYVSLPHSRIDIDGAIGKALNVSLKTQNLNDFLAAAGAQGDSVSLNHGDAAFSGTVTGGLRAPRIAGHAESHSLVVEGRQFDSVAADLVASSSGAAVSNGAVTRAHDGAGLHAQFSASVGLDAWKMPPREPVRADLSITSGDLADLAALAGQNSTGYSGAITVMAHVAGTAGNPLGSVSLQAAKGNIAGQPFDQAHLQAELTDQLVTIPASYIQTGNGRIDLTGEFRHHADSFTTGQVHAKIVSHQVDLATIVAPEKPNMSGTVQMNLDVTGDLSKAEFLLTSADGNVTARAIKIDGQSYGDIDASLKTSAQTASYTLTSDFAGSSVRVTGNTRLMHDYPTTAEAVIADLPVDKVLAAAKQTDIPAKGNLSGTVHVTGTFSDPHGDGNIQMTHAVLYDEPVDNLSVKASYLANSIDITQFQVVAGDSRIELTARFDHPVGNLQTGNASFNITNGRLDLARIHNIQTRRPGLAGLVQIAGRGSGALGSGRTQSGRTQNAGTQQIALHDLTASISATGVKAEGENFGDLKLTADMAAGNKINFALDSSLAGASLRGRGTADLTDGYPVNAQLTFNNVLYSHIAKLAGLGSESLYGVEAATDGQISINGPVLHTEQLSGSLQLSTLNITAKVSPGAAKPVTIANQGPLAATLDRGTVRIQNAHLTGPAVDIQASGNASINKGAMALTLDAKTDLGILENFDKSIYSSGNVTLTAAVRGTTSEPQISGQLALHDATFNYAGLPNGISKANGIVILSGKAASIQNLTAESGGGKLTLTGFAEYGDPSRFGIHVKASGVRARVQPGVSVTANADVQLTGTSRHSVVSGSAVVEQVNYNPQTDIASLLSRAAPSAESDTAPSPMLESMRLDVTVKTASGLAVQADIAQGISATADLRVQGTAARPGVLGRVTINEGKLVFLGSSFTVESGTIGFYNPLRIDPVLDVSLETQTKGIDVIVRVTGPVYNMNLSYTSNPPLQFQEIVALLATGKTPTSDPTLLANEPQLPQASFQQMGESAVLGEAVANPVAGRLQRVFGVSQLKIDPAFQNGSNVPTAKLTLQQRITSNVTFTYTSALDDPNGEIVTVEWAFDPKWSAVATRDQNGIFSVNFLYKRQFR